MLWASVVTKITFMLKNSTSLKEIEIESLLPCTAFTDTILIKEKWPGKK